MILKQFFLFRLSLLTVTSQIDTHVIMFKHDVTWVSILVTRIKFILFCHVLITVSDQTRLTHSFFLI